MAAAIRRERLQELLKSFETAVRMDEGEKHSGYSWNFEAREKEVEACRNLFINEVLHGPWPL